MASLSDGPSVGGMIRPSDGSKFVFLNAKIEHLYENHRGSPTMTLLNVLGVLGFLNMLNMLNVLNVINMPMDAPVTCRAFFFFQTEALLDRSIKSSHIHIIPYYSLKSNFVFRRDLASLSDVLTVRRTVTIISSSVTIL